ncbi:MAG TPA: hypothetical protein VIL78_20270 [Hanamia sp.]
MFTKRISGNINGRPIGSQSSRSTKKKSVCPELQTQDIQHFFNFGVTMDSRGNTREN